MTLHEAIDVRVDVDSKTGTKLTHSEVYGRAVELLGGLDVIAPLIPYPIEFIRERLEADPHLNNTNLHLWDAAAGFDSGPSMNLFWQGYDCRFVGGGIWNLYRKHGINIASCNDGVCILKEAAYRLAICSCSGPATKRIESLVEYGLFRPGD